MGRRGIGRFVIVVFFVAFACKRIGEPGSLGEEGPEGLFALGPSGQDKRRGEASSGAPEPSQEMPPKTADLAPCSPELALQPCLCSLGGEQSRACTWGERCLPQQGCFPSCRERKGRERCFCENNYGQDSLCLPDEACLLDAGCFPPCRTLHAEAEPQSELACLCSEQSGEVSLCAPGELCSPAGLCLEPCALDNKVEGEPCFCPAKAGRGQSCELGSYCVSGDGCLPLCPATFQQDNRVDCVCLDAQGAGQVCPPDHRCLQGKGCRALCSPRERIAMGEPGCLCLDALGLGSLCTYGGFCLQGLGCINLGSKGSSLNCAENEVELSGSCEPRCEDGKSAGEDGYCLCKGAHREYRLCEDEAICIEGRGCFVDFCEEEEGNCLCAGDEQNQYCDGLSRCVKGRCLCPLYDGQRIACAPEERCSEAGCSPLCKNGEGSCNCNSEWEMSYCHAFERCTESGCERITCPPPDWDCNSKDSYTLIEDGGCTDRCARARRRVELYEGPVCLPRCQVGEWATKDCACKNSFGGYDHCLGQKCEKDYGCVE